MTSSALPSRRFGTIGSIVGLLALVAAVLPHWVIPMVFPPPPIDQVIVDTGHRLKERLIARAKGTEYHAPQRERTDADRWNDGLAIAAVSLGLLAIVFAVCALIFREERVLAGTATALGVGAIAFQLAIVAMGALILIVIVYVAMDHLSLF
jgi:hypothetical protein